MRTLSGISHISTYYQIKEQILSIINSMRIFILAIALFFTSCSSTPMQSSDIDLPDGASTYAITKAIGEEIKNEHLVVRTSVIGPELSNRTEELFNWFMSQDHEVEGYQTAIWSGVTTLILARSIEELINKDLIGIYHVTNNSSISKHHLLELLKRQTEKEISIIPVIKNNSDKSFVDTRLKLKLTIPSYEQMIIEMVEFIRANNQRYNLYHLK